MLPRIPVSTRVLPAAVLAALLLPASSTPAAPTFKEASRDLGLEPGNGPSAWIDYDGDGWVDLCAAGTLWRNVEAKRFVKVASPGAAVFADFDNDGYPDAFSWSSRRFLRNRKGTELVPLDGPELPHSSFMAASWADHDGDGFVDIYAGGYETWPGKSYADVILRNVAAADGRSRRFELVWQQPEADLQNFRGRCRGVTSCDFDNDGDVDIYTSNYRQRPNHLWRNDGKGNFRDEAGPLGIAGDPKWKNGYGHTIGSAWGDLDNDGNFDLFVGNFNHHDARISEDSKFYRNLGPKGGYRFEDKSAQAGLAWQESYASCALADADNDGDLDLFFTTVYGVGSFNIRNYPVLYRNDGKWKFTDITKTAGLAELPPTYQAAWADFDNDGDLDLVTAGKLFVNQGSANHWIKVRLEGDGKTVNRSAIGAQVRIKTPAGLLARQVEAGTGQGNQNELTLHFGLADHAGPVQLEITWPGGRKQVVGGVQADRMHVVRAAPAEPARGTVPEPSRVAAIAGTLAPRPRGVGRPIGDRAAWERMRSLPGFQDILKKARSASGKPLPVMDDETFLDFSRTGNRSRGQRVIRARHGRFPLLVLAECLENKGRFLPAIRSAIRSVCGENTWMLPAHDRSLRNYRRQTIEIDLNSSATSWQLATALYWLGEKLDEETRKLVRDELERRTFRPYEESIRTGKPRLWWVTGTNNWNSVCHAGVVGAALAVIESAERRAFFIAAAEKNIEHFLDGFTPDGYCSEGLGYWNYGFGHFVLLAETIRQATAGKVDLLARPEVARIARFGPRMEILPGIYPAFADCSVGSRPDRRILAFLGRRLGESFGPADPSVLAASTTSLFTLGVYGFGGDAAAPAPANVKPAAKGLRDWFPDAGILVARPAPGTTGAMGAALKGGNNAEHHNHNDVGSYVVAIAGRTPLVDPGAEVYTARTFSARRYDSKLLNSFGHPVPVIAGKLQRTGRRAAAKILQAEFTAQKDTLVLDIRSAYDVAALKRLVRTFVFSREGKGSLVVSDEVGFSKPATFETALITLSGWRRSSPDLLAVGSGPGAVEVRIDTGGLPFDVDEARIDENVRTRTKPTRIGIRLAKPVVKARVTLTIEPLGKAP